MGWGYLIGARFGTPSADKLETNAIGLGMTALVSRRYRSLKQGSGHKAMILQVPRVMYLPVVVFVSQLFHPRVSSCFHCFPKAVSVGRPSASFQVGLGDSVNLKPDIALNGGRGSVYTLCEVEKAANRLRYQCDDLLNKVVFLR